jgi:hypothetical protein
MNRHKDAVAYHEAGHAAVAAVLGILRNDTIITISSALKGEDGSVSFSKRPSEQWSARYTRRFILALYAGPAVTEKLFPGIDLLEEGGVYESDLIFAEYLMRSCAPGSWEATSDPVFQSYKDMMWKRAVALVDSNWQAITALANELLKRKTMTGIAAKTALAAATTLHPEQARTRTATI